MRSKKIRRAYRARMRRLGVPRRVRRNVMRQRRRYSSWR